MRDIVGHSNEGDIYPTKDSANAAREALYYAIARLLESYGVHGMMILFSLPFESGDADNELSITTSSLAHGCESCIRATLTATLVAQPNMLKIVLESVNEAIKQVGERWEESRALDLFNGLDAGKGPKQ